MYESGLLSQYRAIHSNLLMNRISKLNFVEYSLLLAWTT